MHEGPVHGEPLRQRLSTGCTACNGRPCGPNVQGYETGGPGRSFVEGAVIRQNVTYTTTRMVQEQCVKQVPYTVMQNVVENCTKKVPCKVCRMVQTTCTKKVAQQVTEMVQETCVKKVPYTCCVQEKYTVCKQVPYTVCEKVPYTVRVKVPYTVCEQVPVTVCKKVAECVAEMVPVQHCRQVPVTVNCEPAQGLQRRHPGCNTGCNTEAALLACTPAAARTPAARCPIRGRERTVGSTSTSAAAAIMAAARAARPVATRAAPAAPVAARTAAPAAASATTKVCCNASSSTAWGCNPCCETSCNTTCTDWKLQLIVSPPSGLAAHQPRRVWMWLTRKSSFSVMPQGREVHASLLFRFHDSPVSAHERAGADKSISVRNRIT